jgi:hypothetical protein
MPAERVSMRKIRDALRLTYALGMSRRLVSEATGIGKTAVGEYVRRAVAAGLGWPIPDEIDDAELERRLFPLAEAGPSAHPYGDEAARRDAGAALARVSRPAYPRLRLQLVLRAV